MKQVYVSKYVGMVKHKEALLHIKGVKTFPLNVEGCRDGSTKK